MAAITIKKAAIPGGIAGPITMGVSKGGEAWFSPFGASIGFAKRKHHIKEAIPSLKVYET